MLEHLGAIVASSHETFVKDFARVQDGTRLSLAQLEDVPYTRLLKRLQTAPMFFATRDRNCDHKLDGCEGYGVRYEGADAQALSMQVTLAVAMEDDETASAAVDASELAIETMTQALDQLAAWGRDILNEDRNHQLKVENLRQKDNLLLADATVSLEHP